MKTEFKDEASDVNWPCYAWLGLGQVDEIIRNISLMGVDVNYGSAPEFSTDFVTDLIFNQKITQ